MLRGSPDYAPLRPDTEIEDAQEAAEILVAYAKTRQLLNGIRLSLASLTHRVDINAFEAYASDLLGDTFGNLPDEADELINYEGYWE
jgi:hypothetical protein